MARRSLAIVQQRPTQIDAPLFRRVAELGVDLVVHYAQLEQPLDTELGIQPEFGDRLLDGYRWQARIGPFPPGAHVIVAGWAQRYALAAILRQVGSGRTLGVRFDTIARRRSTGIRGAISLGRERAALRLADVWHPVGAASEGYAKALVSHARPIVRIPYTIEDSLFKHCVDVRPSTEITALVVAKLNEREGVRDVIIAAAPLPGVRLRVVGDGELRGELEALAGSLGLDAEFVGYVPYTDLPRYYADADVFVHAARVEPWGVSVQEAMASCLPVLASGAVGSSRELLPLEQSTWCFEPGDTERLAALLRSMRDPAIRRLHASANSRAADATSLEATALALCALVGHTP